MEKRTLRFIRDKVTTNMVRFVEEGRAPVVGRLYVQRWAAGNACALNVTVEEVQSSQPTNQGDSQ